MKDYFNRLSKKPHIQFIVTVALIAFFIKVPFGILGTYIVQYLGLINPLFSSTLQEPTLTGEDMFLAIIFAPILETLLAQMIPIEIFRRFTSNGKVLVVSSALLFMLFHYPVLEFFPSAFMVGVMLSWAWLVKRPLGLWKSFLIVTLIHSLHNALVGLTASFFM